MSQKEVKPEYEPYVNPMAPADTQTTPETKQPSEHTNKEPAKTTPAEAPKEPPKKAS